tara:strand:+ start:901 stop:1590 length:690 start_codon:yes stop_codon:yes gene_type:complete
MKLRIQKYLSQQGIVSRRKAEAFLKKGWILVNGEVVTKVGTQIDPTKDIVCLAEEAQLELKTSITLLIYKPKGVVTNCKQEGEREVIDLLPGVYRQLSAIGRLDKDSEGLIVFTDNGVLANQFLNSDLSHERVYEVTTAHPVSQDQLTPLSNGVDIGGYMTKPCQITQVSLRRLEMTLTEGKNRQIRRMMHSVGNRVHRLKRVRFGPYRLGNLNPGEYHLVEPHKGHQV